MTEIITDTIKCLLWFCQQDYWSTTTGSPPKDATQNYELINGTEDGGQTVVEFSRDAVTGDNNDVQFMVRFCESVRHVTSTWLERGNDHKQKLFDLNLGQGTIIISQGNCIIKAIRVCADGVGVEMGVLSGVLAFLAVVLFTFIVIKAEECTIIIINIITTLSPGCTLYFQSHLILSIIIIIISAVYLPICLLKKSIKKENLNEFRISINVTLLQTKLIYSSCSYFGNASILKYSFIY